jgi:hypothetical protein
MCLKVRRSIRIEWLLAVVMCVNSRMNGQSKKKKEEKGKIELKRTTSPYNHDPQRQQPPK